MFDIVIKGGRLIDPSQSIDAAIDVAINKDKIAAVAKDIPSKDGKEVVDAKGMIVTPGLIDIHTHVYDGVCSNGNHPDIAGVNQGVTTTVDAGSAGQAIFAAFPKYIVPTSQTTVFCFLNIGSLGLSLQPEFRDSREINVEATKSVVSSYRELIKGIKVRLLGPLTALKGLEVLKIAKEVARDFSLPVMLHIGNTANDTDCVLPDNLTAEAISLLEKGDILSHMYTARPGSAMRPDGTFIPELMAAMERGVICEASHGRFNLSHEVARKGIARGILPHAIGSDLTSHSLHGPVYGLSVIMSVFLALGLTLNQVITMTTINPAIALSITDTKGSLKQGMDADITIMELESGKWNLLDAEGNMLTATQLIFPRLTIKAGKTIVPEPAAGPEQTT